MCMTQRELSFAVKEAIRGWVAFDGMQRQWIEQNEAERLSVETIRRIAIEYGFARNIPGGDNRDHAVELVADHLQRFHGEQAQTLNERAECVQTAVERLRCAHKCLGYRAPHRLVSGMTKLVWFVAPASWTPYDDLAATGLDIRKSDTMKRMRAFYRKLDERGFVQMAADIQTQLNGTPCRILS